MNFTTIIFIAIFALSSSWPSTMAWPDTPSKTDEVNAYLLDPGYFKNLYLERLNELKLKYEGQRNPILSPEDLKMVNYLSDLRLRLSKNDGSSF